MSSNLPIVGRHWRGYKSLKHIVVFGASYCEVGYSPLCPHPSKERPLGVDFPGTTYAEAGEPNWVGYLTRDHSPSGDFESDPLLVYDYGLGGQTANGVKYQVENMFLSDMGMEPKWVHWTAEDTLFITWVGINDCGFVVDPMTAIQTLIKAQEALYTGGARNFLLVDVPPMQRSPLGPVRASRKRDGDPYENWNAELRRSALAFGQGHQDASVLVFSSWDLFTAVLDNPVQYGFKEDDSSKARGRIWIDRLHPTTKMHKIIAEKIVDYLISIEPQKRP